MAQQVYLLAGMHANSTDGAQACTHTHMDTLTQTHAPLVSMRLHSRCRHKMCRWRLLWTTHNTRNCTHNTHTQHTQHTHNTRNCTRAQTHTQHTHNTHSCTRAQTHLWSPRDGTAGADAAGVDRSLLTAATRSPPDRNEKRSPRLMASSCASCLGDYKGR